MNQAQKIKDGAKKSQQEYQARGKVSEDQDVEIDFEALNDLDLDIDEDLGDFDEDIMANS